MVPGVGTKYVNRPLAILFERDECMVPGVGTKYVNSPLAILFERDE